MPHRSLTAASAKEPSISLSRQIYETPSGRVILVANDTELVGVIYPAMWLKFAAKLGFAVDRDRPLLRKAKQQLDEYFDGSRRTFDLPLGPIGTPFQKRVWNALHSIPFGETRTYKFQAGLIDAPLSSRAVGRANGLNPLSIVVPCHRIVGSSGALTGYAGGLEMKQFLLAHEGGSQHLG